MDGLAHRIKFADRDGFLAPDRAAVARQALGAPHSCAAFSGWVRAHRAGLVCACFHEIDSAGTLAVAGDYGSALIADIGAYFSGKKFGKRKLAPAISPGKTWEGVAGAAICMLIYALVLNQIGGIFAVLSIPVLLLLLVLSIAGDLFESLMKRQAGIKDSSQLLPGHGGVLDRIDSQLSVLPVALLMIILSVGH